MQLNVTGIPIIQYPTEIDFGQVYVGYPDTIEYVISNVGTDLLLIDGITFQDTWLSSEQENLSIAPQENTSLYLIAEIDNPETYVTNMSFTTNDLQNSIVENVMVGATAVNPPVMNVSQSEFVFTHSSESSEINEFLYRILVGGVWDGKWYLYLQMDQVRIGSFLKKQIIVILLQRNTKTESQITCG